MRITIYNKNGMHLVSLRISFPSVITAIVYHDNNIMYIVYMLQSQAPHPKCVSSDKQVGFIQY